MVSPFVWICHGEKKQQVSDKGSFFNYIDQIVPIIDHLPSVDIFKGIPLLV